jgi:hypothetical protein
MKHFPFLLGLAPLIKQVDVIYCHISSDMVLLECGLRVTDV